MQLDLTRPNKLYRYSDRQWLEKSLLFGEFRIRPASDYKTVEEDLARHDDELIRQYSSPGKDVRIIMESGREIAPVGDVNYRYAVGTNYLTLCFSDRCDNLLFDEFPNTNSCLIVHNVDEFCERMHNAVESALPKWAGVDGAVLYGGSSPLGAVFSKPLRFIVQHEWRFAWYPPAVQNQLMPILVSIGNIEKIAELVPKPSTGDA